jgi:predicted dehydrogenase
MCEAKLLMVVAREVVTEKPWVTSSAKATEIIQLAKGSGKVMAVFHSKLSHIK